MRAESARFLTVDECARVLNVEGNVIQQLVDSGELAAIEVSAGVWRIERAVLEMFIEGKYEETRRRARWAEAQFDELPEFDSGEGALRRLPG